MPTKQTPQEPAEEAKAPQDTRTEKSEAAVEENGTTTTISSSVGTTSVSEELSTEAQPLEKRSKSGSQPPADDSADDSADESTPENSDNTDNNGGDDAREQVPLTAMFPALNGVEVRFNPALVSTEILRVLRREPPSHGWKFPRPRFGNADIEQYQSQALDWMDVPDNARSRKNIEFFQNKRKSKPMGDFIENIHSDWKGDYGLLERHHGYIQWLFPIHAHGVTFESQPLQAHERKAIAADAALIERLLANYELMLDFYGFRLADRNTGVLELAEHHNERFSNLVGHPHNYLRITRILKCLGLHDLRQHQSCFMAKVLEVVLWDGKLRRAASSATDYWLGALLSVDDRTALEQLILANSK
jgi:hypothetical protein